MSLRLRSVLVLSLCVGVSTLRSPTSHAVVSIRGGGVFGTPVTKENMLTLYSAFYGLNGALGMPAPEATSDFGTFPPLKEGTADYVVYENLGAVSLGYAIMVYLSSFSHMSPARVVAYSGLPYAYVTYKNQLKGLFKKLGAPAAQGPVQSIFMLLCAYMLFSGKGDANLIAKLYALPPLVIGATGEINPDFGIKMAGFGSLSGPGKTFFIWFAAPMTGFGLLAMMLLNGQNATKSIGYAALLEALFMIDCIWIRKWNRGVAPDASNYVFLGIPLITAAALLMK